MIVAVFDANVLVAGIGASQTSNSRPGTLLRRCYRGDFELVVSEHIPREVEAAPTSKRYFRDLLTARETVMAVTGLRELARVAPVDAIVPGVAPHRHDAVLATVAASGAD